MGEPLEREEGSVRIDARVGPCEGWIVYRGDTDERMKLVVYIDDRTSEFGYHDDPPRTTQTEVIVNHKVAKRIAIYPETKIARIWE